MANQNSKRKTYFISVVIGLQLVFFLTTIGIFSMRFEAISATAHFISVVAIVSLINKETLPTFKLAWIMLIMVFPIFGGVIYYLFGDNRATKKIGKRYATAKANTLLYSSKNAEPWEQLDKTNPYLASQSKYLTAKGYPVFNNTNCKYYPMADSAYVDILEELRVMQ